MLGRQRDQSSSQPRLPKPYPDSHRIMRVVDWLATEGVATEPPAHTKLQPDNMMHPLRPALLYTTRLSFYFTGPYSKTDHRGRLGLWPNETHYRVTLPHRAAFHVKTVT